MSAPVIDQLMLYDQALLTWVTNTLPPLLVGRNTQILFATQKRSFAEVTTGQIIDNKTLSLPRISITRMDSVNDPSRFNSNRIRRLGWDDNNYQKKLKSGKFPSPINIPYQIDLWTRHGKEINLWEQKILFEFSPQYIYLSIYPDNVWMDKKYIVFLDGPIVNNSDLEPGSEDRTIRKTLSLRAEARLYDQEIIVVPVVKSIEMRWLDYDDESQFDRTFLPPLDTIASGNGSQQIFGPIYLIRKPVLKHTVVIQATLSGTGEILQDNGSGVLSGERSSGTINYSTGEVNLNFSLPPDNFTQIYASYFKDLS